MMARIQFSWYTAYLNCTKLWLQPPMSPKSDAVDTPTVVPAFMGNGGKMIISSRSPSSFKDNLMLIHNISQRTNE